MNKPVTIEVIRQALHWQGVRVSTVRCLSAFEDNDHNTLADYVLTFERDDFIHWAEMHGMDWREAMLQDFRATVESSFCRDFGPWYWTFDREKMVIKANVSFLLFASDKQANQLSFEDISWSCGDDATL